MPGRERSVACVAVGLASSAIALALLCGEGDRPEAAPASTIAPASTTPRPARDRRAPKPLRAPRGSSGLAVAVLPLGEAAPRAPSEPDDAVEGHDHSDHAPPFAGPSLESIVGGLAAAAAARDPEALETARALLRLAAPGDRPRACLLVLAALRGASEPEQVAALGAALSDVAEGRAAPALLEGLEDVALRDAVAVRREVAATVLGELPYPDAERARSLGSITRLDPDARVREAAAVALGVLAEHAPGDDAARAAAREVAGSLALEREASVRARLVHAVRDAGEPATADALLSTLASDREPSVRASAAFVLGELGEGAGGRIHLALSSRAGTEPDALTRSTIVAAAKRTAIRERKLPGGKP